MTLSIYDTNSNHIFLQFRRSRFQDDLYPLYKDRYNLLDYFFPKYKLTTHYDYFFLLLGLLMSTRIVLL